jgi:hypothetical protein
MGTCYYKLWSHLKGVKLRAAITIFTALVLSIIAGCEGTAEDKKLVSGEKSLLKKDKELLTVDFQEGRSLRYKFVTTREIALDWDPTKSRSKPGQSSVDKSTESTEMVFTYTPLKVDPYGLTTIKATCESVKVNRTSRSGRTTPRDAVEHLPGKSFTLAVNASGKIEDYTSLDELIRQIGDQAFRKGNRGGRIKEPDLIADFIVTQRFLWDSISSIENPADGVSIGQSWNSQLLVPTPMVMQQARDVTYTLDEIHPTDKGRLAVIKSSYSLPKLRPKGWPMPYEGNFRMAGTFGFFRGYPTLGLKGEGEELFNIDAGKIEKYNQQYEAQFNAVLPGPLGPNPLITINQKITMQLLN